jgi:DNA-directed RNA polymerase II subunit RPB2
MTMGQLIECLLGKVCALTGNLGDGTPFRGTSVETIADALQAQGFSRYGKEKMYSG